MPRPLLDQESGTFQSESSEAACDQIAAVADQRLVSFLVTLTIEWTDSGDQSSTFSSGDPGLFVD